MLTWGPEDGADRAVSARFSRHRPRLAQGRAAAGRRRVAGGGTVHARLRAVVDRLGRQLSHRRADGRRVAGARGGRPDGTRRDHRSRLGGDGGRRAGRDARQPVRQGRDHVGPAGRGVAAQTPASACAARWRRCCPGRRSGAGTRSTSNCLGCQNGPRPGWCRCCGDGGRPATTPQEDLRHVHAALGTPANWRAALGYYRATLRPGSAPPERYAELHRHWTVGAAAADAVHARRRRWMHDRQARPTGRRRVLPADSRMRIVEDAGHFLQLEQPDAVARHILDFVGSGSAV